MLKIYNMNKIIVVLFLFSISFSFAQNSKKDEVITKITTSLCECTSKGKIKKDNVKVGLGICLIEAMNSHKTELLKAYKTNKINKLGWFPVIELKNGLIKTIKEVNNLINNE